MTDFAATGTGDGIGWGLCDDIASANIHTETIIDPRFYHTIKEGKNGLGPAPIKTKLGWLHWRMACATPLLACGMCCICSCAICMIRPSSLSRRAVTSWLRKTKNEWVTCRMYCSQTAGWARSNGDVFIYYASSDSRTHVATTTVDRLLDYVMNTPEDALRSRECVEQRCRLIDQNQRVQAKKSRKK